MQLEVVVVIDKMMVTVGCSKLARREIKVALERTMVIAPFSLFESLMVSPTIDDFINVGNGSLISIASL